MQIRNIFGTMLPPAAGETEPVELKCGSIVTLDDATAQGLVDAGRAEVYPAAAPAPTAGK